MTSQTKPDSTVTVTKARNGAWVFVIKHLGVTYPAQGDFFSMLQAQAVGLKALQSLKARQPNT